MKLILVRHAEAEHNLTHLMVAHGESKLTKKGEAQVSRLAERMRKEKIDAAFSSDSERALHTAQGILLHHPKLRLQISEQIRERHMGDLEGKTRDEFVAVTKASGQKWYEHKPAGGESMLETQDRAKTFVHEIWDKYRGKTVLVVSHGGFLRALLAHLLQHDYNNAPPLRILNTAVTIVEMRDDQPHVVQIMNDASHLDEETKPIVH